MKFNYEDMLPEAQMMDVRSLLEDDHERCFLTGTRAYGPASKDSDWDVVMRDKDVRPLYDLLMLLKIQLKMPAIYTPVTKDSLSD